ncbi:MAG TPA: hypothetical protein VIL12_02915 [Acidimicrobiia bacterium]
MVLMGLAVVLTVAAVSIRSDTRALVAFFDTANRVATAQANRAGVFQSLVREDLDTVDREKLMTLVEELREGVRDGAAEVAATEPPGVGLGARDVLVLALESWDEGLGAFHLALLDAVDQPQSPVPERDLELALTQIRVGDAAYAKFLEVAGDLESALDVEVGPLPLVAYLDGDLPIVASRVAEAARLSPSLALLVDVGISAVRMDPEEVAASESNVTVIPATEALDVQIVVANHGNRIEQLVRVALTLSTDGGQLLVQDEQMIAELMPGSQQTAMFDALPVVPGEAYDLEVAVGKVADEKASELENNFHRRRFLVNATVEA